MKVALATPLVQTLSNHTGCDIRMRPNPLVMLLALRASIMGG